jgi:hypothetical protein
LLHDMGIDDLLKQMMEDEREDRLATQTLSRPIEYARSRGFAPQKVYAALRNKKLDWHICDCGHKCVNIEEADELFGIKKEEDELRGHDDLHAELPDGSPDRPHVQEE